MAPPMAYHICGRIEHLYTISAAWQRPLSKSSLKFEPLPESLLHNIRTSSILDIQNTPGSGLCSTNDDDIDENDEQLDDDYESVDDGDHLHEILDNIPSTGSDDDEINELVELHSDLDEDSREEPSTSAALADLQSDK